jgi:hypothetical protein
MNTFLLILMVMLLIAALEPANRRQPPRAPGLHGSLEHDDRDWARIKVDLLVLGDQAQPTHEPVAPPGPAQMPSPGLPRIPKPAQRRWNTNHRNAPPAA